MNECDRYQCAACRGELPRLTDPEIDAKRLNLNSGWIVTRERRLKREYGFRDFKSALDFAIRVSDIADEMGHHPEMQVAWGKACFTIWTYAVDGLTQADFDLARAIDVLGVTPPTSSIELRSREPGSKTRRV